MKFFIDTANLDQIREANELGVLDGVTTNPSLMAKEGIKGVENQRRHYIKICGLNPHIVVKVPCIEAGIKAIKYFSGKGIRTNCTLVFSPGQALLAAKAGATYVSPFVGRLDDIASDGIELVRSTQHIIQCVEAGADVATCPLSAIKGLLKHPLTDSGLATFLADYKKVNG